MTIQEMRDLKLVDLQKKIIETKKEIFELYFKQAQRQAVKPHLFKKYKRALARLLTIEHQSGLIN